MVEVISRKNTRAEIARKPREYFDSGCRLVWVVDPRSETVAVLADSESPTTLCRGELLDGGAVLPGFTLPLD